MCYIITHNGKDKTVRNETIKEVFERLNGVVRSSDIEQIGAHRGSLKYLADSGQIERIARGVYARLDAWVDDLFVLQNRFARGVYSCETALFLHGLSVRTPTSWTMTFPAHYNTASVVAEGIECHQKSRALYGLGIVRVQSPYGGEVSVYSREVTLCDVLRPRNQVDIQLVSDAFRAYVKRNDGDMNELARLAKVFHVEAKLRSYMEVLV